MGKSAEEREAEKKAMMEARKRELEAAHEKHSEVIKMIPRPRGWI